MDFTETTVGESKEFPAKTIIYGVPKIGKSRFASQFPDVFFLNVEGGLDYLEKKVRSTPKLNSFDDVMAWLMHIYENEDFTCGTIAIDSLDWIEELSQAKLSALHGGKSVSDKEYKPFAYGAGTSMAAEQVARVFKALDKIYEKKGIKGILIAHSKIKDVDVPNKDNYSQFQLKLSGALSKKTMEWADLILFADYHFEVTQDGKTSEPIPMLYAGGDMAFEGGGRMKLKKNLPLNYQTLFNHITKGE